MWPKITIMGSPNSNPLLCLRLMGNVTCASALIDVYVHVDNGDALICQGSHYRISSHIDAARWNC